MTMTLEDHERRITALEKAAETEKNIVRAVSEIVADSEQRIKAEIKRLDNRISTTEGRVIDVLNERFDAVMTALDKLHNPPR